tara:strand:+ start:111 stop:266 length:156 start_codon:yes stop_codon:yes gene_type:complete
LIRRGGLFIEIDINQRASPLERVLRGVSELNKTTKNIPTSSVSSFSRRRTF